MLNSASTIATMDIYARFSGQTDQKKLVSMGRALVVVFVLLAASLAPFLDDLGSIFKYIQEFQGFISPGILGVFIFGFFSPRTPKFFGWLGIAVNAIAYGSLKWRIGPFLVKTGMWYSDVEMAFLDRMAICLGLAILTGIVVTITNPLKTPVTMPENKDMDLSSSPGARLCGIGVCVATVALYIVFW